MGRGRGRRVALKLKLQITGGQANPAPPVGPALGQAQVNRSEERRVGKECRSLCDWSSDVCSTDLRTRQTRRAEAEAADHGRPGQPRAAGWSGTRTGAGEQIGRASCRERV